jgi:hypothetical protein
LSNGYIEKHHIIPRSLGGSNDKENIVSLSGREHYIAHLLLARFNRCSKTAYALWMMQMKNSKDCDRPRIKSGRMYEWIRKEIIKYTSRNNRITSKGERNSQHGTRWICNIKLQENRKVSKDELILDGWILGRNKWVVSTYVPKKYINICNLVLQSNSRIIYGEDIPDGWVKGKNKWLTRKRKDTKTRVKKTRAELKFLSDEKLKGLAKTLWAEFFISNHESLNSFAKEKGLIRMTIKGWFKKYIPEYPSDITTKSLKKHITGT